MTKQNIPPAHAVGVCRFKSLRVAEEVEAAKIGFAATVNREGQTPDERDAAFRKFFNLKR